jgi:hypothetical protein
MRAPFFFPGAGDLRDDARRRRQNCGRNPALAPLMKEREILASLYAIALLRHSLAVLVVTPRGSKGVKRFVVLAQAPGIFVIRVHEAARGTQERAETVAVRCLRLASGHGLLRNAEALHRLLVFARVSSEIHKRCCQANLSMAISATS